MFRIETVNIIYIFSSEMSYLVEEVSCTLAIKHVLKYVPGAKFQFYESVKKKVKSCGMRLFSS